MGAHHCPPQIGLASAHETEHNPPRARGWDLRLALAPRSGPARRDRSGPGPGCGGFFGWRARKTEPSNWLGVVSRIRARARARRERPVRRNRRGRDRRIAAFQDDDWALCRAARILSIRHHPLPPGGNPAASRRLRGAARVEGRSGGRLPPDRRDRGAAPLLGRGAPRGGRAPPGDAVRARARGGRREGGDPGPTRGLLRAGGRAARGAGASQAGGAERRSRRDAGAGRGGARRGAAREPRARDRAGRHRRPRGAPGPPSSARDRAREGGGALRPGPGARRCPAKAAFCANRSRCRWSITAPPTPSFAPAR